MQSRTRHYHQSLGLPSNWTVEHVNLSITGKQVEIRLVYEANRSNARCVVKRATSTITPVSNGGVTWMPCSSKRF